MLRDEQPQSEGVATTEALLRALGIAATQRLSGAYLDLLAASSAGIASAR